MHRTRSSEPSPLPDRSTPNADYRILFQSNPQPMWVFDRETLRFLAVNDAAVARYGYTAADFLSMSILDIRPPEDRAVVRSVVDALPEEGLGSPGCWRHRTKDGRDIDVELSTQSVRFEGSPAVMVLAIDVTAQVEAQREAKLHERALRALNEALVQERAWLLRSQEVARIGAWEIDLTTSDVIWSTGTFRLFGVDPASFCPTHAAFLEFVHPEDRSTVDAGSGPRTTPMRYTPSGTGSSPGVAGNSSLRNAGTSNGTTPGTRSVPTGPARTSPNVGRRKWHSRGARCGSGPCSRRRPRGSSSHLRPGSSSR